MSQTPSSNPNSDSNSEPNPIENSILEQNVDKEKETSSERLDRIERILDRLAEQSVVNAQEMREGREEMREGFFRMWDGLEMVAMQVNRLTETSNQNQMALARLIEIRERQWEAVQQFLDDRKNRD